MMVATPSDARFFLCLLDNVEVEDCPITLGDCVIRRLEKEELAAIFEVRCISCQHTRDTEDINLLAQFPWAEKRDDSASRPRNTQHPSHAMLQSWSLSFAHSGRRTWHPFSNEFLAINLATTSSSPIRPCRFLNVVKCSTGDIRLDESITYAHPACNCEQEGNTWPIWSDFTLRRNIANTYDHITRQLELIHKKSNEETLTYLSIALDAFALGDRIFFEDEFGCGPLRSFIQYVSSMESLMILESERGVSCKLRQRVPEIIDHCRTCLEHFIGRAYCIRSKALHGVKPISQLRSFLWCKSGNAGQGSNSGIQNAKVICESKYAEMFVTTDHFAPFLSNTRELARRCLRYFMDESVPLPSPQAGKSKKEIICTINNRT